MKYGDVGKIIEISSMMLNITTTKWDITVQFNHGIEKLTDQSDRKSSTHKGLKVGKIYRIYKINQNWPPQYRFLHTDALRILHLRREIKQ